MTSGHGRRCVALRADIDALPLHEATGLPFASTVPNVMHACGHDAHTAMVLGAGLALASAPALPGRVRLIFQPAEEVQPGGAMDMVADGAVDGVERIFALHCDPRLEVGKLGTRTGPITSACDLVEIELASPGGHTARPHLTADLVEALGLLITQLPLLLTRHVDPRSGTVLVWGAVHAGEAANAIPQQGVLRGTLRTGDHTTWEALEGLVRTLVGQILAPTGPSTSCRTPGACRRSSTRRRAPGCWGTPRSPCWGPTPPAAPSSPAAARTSPGTWNTCPVRWRGSGCGRVTARCATCTSPPSTWTSGRSRSACGC